MAEQGERYVTITYFIRNMLGFKARGTYYNHLDEPDWPQRVYPLGKPMLVYSECVAYQRKLEAARGPMPVAEASLKRRPGRPVSAPKAARRAAP